MYLLQMNPVYVSSKKPHPKSKNENKEITKHFEVVMEVITNIRNLRKQKNISPKEKLQVFEKVNQGEIIKTYDGIIIPLLYY